MTTLQCGAYVDSLKLFDVFDISHWETWLHRVVYSEIRGAIKDSERVSVVRMVEN